MKNSIGWQKHFTWKEQPEIQKVYKALINTNAKAYFVGGCVRDSIKGIIPKDFDIASTEPPSVNQALLQAQGIKYVNTGIKYGTITAIYGKQTLEVTTLRRDVKTYGRRADVVFSKSFFIDSCRRDFTINALYFDPKQERILDFHGGLADLRRNKVKFIGCPEKRIKEDFLRILRYIRFSAQFNCYDSGSFPKISKLSPGLKLLSKERITAEVRKILTSKNIMLGIRLLNKCNVSNVLFGFPLQSNMLQKLLALHNELGEEKTLKGLLSFPVLLASLICADERLTSTEAYKKCTPLYEALPTHSKEALSISPLESLEEDLRSLLNLKAPYSLIQQCKSAPLERGSTRATKFTSFLQLTRAEKKMMEGIWKIWPFLAYELDYQLHSNNSKANYSIRLPSTSHPGAFNTELNTSIYYLLGGFESTTIWYTALLVASRASSRTVLQDNKIIKKWLNSILNKIKSCHSYTFPLKIAEMHKLAPQACSNSVFGAIVKHFKEWGLENLVNSPRDAENKARQVLFQVGLKHKLNL